MGEQAAEIMNKYANIDSNICSRMEKVAISKILHIHIDLHFHDQTLSFSIGRYLISGDRWANSTIAIK